MLVVPRAGDHPARTGALIAAIAALPGATPVNAIVMASAAMRGDVVFTSDIPDLQRLQQHFPGVRLLRA